MEVILFDVGLKRGVKISVCQIEATHPCRVGFASHKIYYI
jgi:hypothetical protein